jgi:hypothetical protein
VRRPAPAGGGAAGGAAAANGGAAIGGGAANGDGDSVGGAMTPRIGPRKYRAPEVEAAQPYGTPADMYSYGVMIRELLEQLKGRRVRRYGASYDFLRALGRCCMREAPGARPSALDALACLAAHAGRGPLQGGAPSGAPPSRMAASLTAAAAAAEEGGGSGGGAAAARRKRKRTRTRDSFSASGSSDGEGGSDASRTSERVVRLAHAHGGHGRDNGSDDDSVGGGGGADE